uniref:Uncharacterized protein n=1 Tax=Triticum urartu TaxID=4572 RepID=A0A8R7UE47_TRIUA
MRREFARSLNFLFPVPLAPRLPITNASLASTQFSRRWTQRCTRAQTLTIHIVASSSVHIISGCWEHTIDSRSRRKSTSWLRRVSDHQHRSDQFQG